MWKYVLFKVALHTLGRLPLPLLYFIADRIGEAVYLLAPRLRANVRDNLRHVLGPDAPKPKLRKAERQVFRNVARYYADLLHLPRMDMDDFFQRRVRYHGFHEHVEPAIAAGKGVIILSAHYGNPELAVQALLCVGIRALALTEPLRPARLSRLVDGLRSSKGHLFLPVSVASVKRALRTLREGGVVALMGDRDIQGPKARLPFCGAETLMPTGPIEVALRTGATVIPSFTLRRPFGIEAHLEEPLELERTGDMERDVRVNTLRFLERLERHLRAEPEQWMVLEAIWEEPAPSPREAAVAAGRKG